MRVKKQILFTIKGKKFSSLDETNLILQDLKFHAEWIHPSSEMHAKSLLMKVNGWIPLQRKENLKRSKIWWKLENH